MHATFVMPRYLEHADTLSTHVSTHNNNKVSGKIIYILTMVQPTGV